MATVLHRTTKELKRSVNTPEYDPLDWIVEPDLSLVEGFANRYWVITGDDVTLADQPTRDAIDAAIAADRAAAELQGQKDRYDGEAVLRAVIKLTVDQLNVLRAQHALPDITYEQARTAIHAALDGGV